MQCVMSQRYFDEVMGVTMLGLSKYSCAVQLCYRRNRGPRGGQHGAGGHREMHKGRQAQLLQPAALRLSTSPEGGDAAHARRQALPGPGEIVTWLGMAAWRQQECT
eukprot:scaffold516649_cov19-Prasinocladus_malaysianus.AAC.1